MPEAFVVEQIVSPPSDSAAPAPHVVEHTSGHDGESACETSLTLCRDEPEASTCEPQMKCEPRVKCEARVSTCDRQAIACDAREQAAALRSEAARFAAIACARALRVTLAENPATIARFVDDALRACGRVDRALVRLNPDDAASYRPQRDVEMTGDELVERGEVVVETERGLVRATLESRAALLTRAASDA